MFKNLFKFSLVVLLFGIIFVDFHSSSSQEVYQQNRRKAFRGGGGTTGGGGNAFSMVTSNAAINLGVTVTIGAGSTGDLIVCGVKWENTGSVSGISGSVNGSYTLKTAASGTPKCIWSYKVAGSTAGETITASFSGSHEAEQLFAFRLSATGTIAFDTEAQGTGSSTAPATGTFTTATANGVTLCICAENSNTTISNPFIGGVAPTAKNPGTQPSGPESWSWYTLNTSQFSSATGSATFAASGAWAISTISFKAT